jgi:hypothetical protein
MFKTENMRSIICEHPPLRLSSFRNAENRGARFYAPWRESLHKEARRIAFPVAASNIPVLQK